MIFFRNTITFHIKLGSTQRNYQRNAFDRIIQSHHLHRVPSQGHRYIAFGHQHWSWSPVVPISSGDGEICLDMHLNCERMHHCRSDCHGYIYVVTLREIYFLFLLFDDEVFPKLFFVLNSMLLLQTQKITSQTLNYVAQFYLILKQIITFSCIHLLFNLLKKILKTLKNIFNIIGFHHLL